MRGITRVSGSRRHRSPSAFVLVRARAFVVVPPREQHRRRVRAYPTPSRRTRTTSRSRASRGADFEIREKRGTRERVREERPGRSREKPLTAVRARSTVGRALACPCGARKWGEGVASEPSPRSKRESWKAKRGRLQCKFSIRCAIFQRLVARRASLLRETRLPHRVPSGLVGRDRRRRAFRERSRATERGPAFRARHSRLAARGRGRGRRRPRLRRRLRGGFRARRLEHLLARHLPRLHVIHVGGRGRRGALVSKEKQRDQPGGGDEGAARRAPPGRASRARAFRRALRLAAGRADDAFGAGDGEARRSETRGASSPGAKASGDAEGARTGVARVRRGASAREREDHACREHLRREMVP